MCVCVCVCVLVGSDSTFSEVMELIAAVAAIVVCLLVPFSEGVGQRNDSFLLVTSSTVDFNITDVADSVQVAVNEVLRESLLHNFNYRVFQAQVSSPSSHLQHSLSNT